MKISMKTEHSDPLTQTLIHPFSALTELQKAQISDLADGQLQGDAFAQAMTLMNASSQARVTVIVGDQQKHAGLWKRKRGGSNERRDRWCSSGSV